MPDKKEIKNETDLYREILNQVPRVVIEAAERNKFEIYAVGGCVRNCLLGFGPGDIDIAVVGDAVKLAKEIAAEIPGAKLAVYKRFGTALVQTENLILEFATARRESYLPDSRKPSEVIPVPIEEDLHRRDFTINTFAVGLSGERTGEFLDLFDGRADLSAGIIRTPLAPAATFSDDPLRMLRAIRFAADLGFIISQDTWQGIKQSCSRLRIVAQERIRDEFFKMLSGSDAVGAMKMLIDTGLMEVFLPEVTAMSGVEQIGRHHHKDVLIHSLKVMQNLVRESDDPILRLAGLLHDVGKPKTKKFQDELGWTFHNHETIGTKIAQQIGRRLKIGKDPLNRLCKLVNLHMRPVNLTSEGVTDSAIRRLMVNCGDETEDQLKLCRADITTANPKFVKKYLSNFDEMKKRMDDVEARDRMRRFQSPIRGDEIMELLDLQPGPLIGAMKERIEDAILDGEIAYDYEAAKEYLFGIKDEVFKTSLDELKRERKKRSRNRNNIDSDFKFPD